MSKNFIITGNKSYVKSYDYSNNNVYHLYCEHEYASHFSVDILQISNEGPNWWGKLKSISNNYEGVIKLVESNTDGIIRVWDFHTAKLLKKIKIRENKLYGVCLLKDHFLFVGCQDKTIKLIELNSGKIIKELKGHNKTVITIKRINHPEYGECLLSQGRLDGKIRLWIFKNIIK
jgi:WD40 repeat protein